MVRDKAANYGPLSIEDSEHNDNYSDDGVDLVTQAHPSEDDHHHYAATRIKRRRGKRVCISLCTLIIILVALQYIVKGLVHVSLFSLIKAVIFDDDAKDDASVDVVCLFDQCSLEGNNYTNQTVAEESIMKLKSITPENLHLDSKAQAFFNVRMTSVDEVTTNGFYWNEEDLGSTTFFPQGITTYHGSDGESRFALASWYGRKDEGYAKLGGRISFIDISNMQQQFDKEEPEEQHLSYCHVLLVDQNFCTLPHIHVGGIEAVHGTLYVADSRKGQYQILMFDIANGLYELLDDMQSNMSGFRYVLRQSSSFPSPIKPSFISYDSNFNKFVVGTYARCGNAIGKHVDSKDCFEGRDTTLFPKLRPRLVWLDSKSDNSNITKCWSYFSEMQGAASARFDNASMIWTSSSYGPISNSHLHVVNVSSSFTPAECPEIDMDVTTYIFPPGLEDLHIEQIQDGRRFMWMLTEFGKRRVFMSPLEQLLPMS